MIQEDLCHLLVVIQGRISQGRVSKLVLYVGIHSVLLDQEQHQLRIVCDRRPVQASHVLGLFPLGINKNYKTNRPVL